MFRSSSGKILSAYPISRIICKALAYLSFFLILITFFNDDISKDIPKYIGYFFLAVVAIGVHLGMKYPRQTLWDDSEYGDTCPYCAKEVPSNASVCNGCQAEKSSTSDKSISDTKIFALLCITVLLIPIAFVGGMFFNESLPFSRTLILEFILACLLLARFLYVVFNVELRTCKWKRVRIA